ncbi:MAG TPA: 5,10-methylenetetrahydrofolate reductase [Armatimonadetes bacterium]|nr:5,10-methylenetetrahydrofolate reductase [Armatimonadota bacterium]
MLAVERKPMEEILRFLEGERRVFLVACGGCPVGAEVGGEPALAEVEEELKGAGKEVTGRVVVDFLCNKALLGIRLLRHVGEIEEADALLVLSCGVGVQAVANTVDKVAYPAFNTLPLGGTPGVWQSTERCAQCGECVLYLTGGLCPLTLCQKQLLNGPCGGTSDGKCEVDPEIDCGWYLIYERLRKLGRLDILRRYVPPKDHSKFRPSAEFRRTRLWALEKVGG